MGIFMTEQIYDLAIVGGGVNGVGIARDAAGRGAKVVKGLALAVEPMVTMHSPYTRTLDDDWTVVTEDGSWAAHFEHTFTLTDDGTWVLTAIDGGKARLDALGVPYGGH